MDLRNRNHHLLIHYDDSSKDASQCSTRVQVGCNRAEFIDIFCSPFDRILLNLMKDFIKSRSFQQLQQSRLVMKLHFDIELFSLLLQFQVENHTNTHFWHVHIVKHQARLYLIQFTLQ